MDLNDVSSWLEKLDRKMDIVLERTAKYGVHQSHCVKRFEEMEIRMSKQASFVKWLLGLVLTLAVAGGLKLTF